MKTIYILLQTLIIALIFNSCTKPTCFGSMDKNDYCSYYPHKDTFNVGDTVWVQLSFPKFFSSDCGSFELKKDSVQVELSFLIGKTINDSVSFYPFDFVNIKGKYIGNAEYYFILAENNQKYLNEFYFILKQSDTGYLRIGNPHHIDITLHIHENISSRKFYFGGIYEKEGSFSTTFSETDSGYFKIYVKP